MKRVCLREWEARYVVVVTVLLGVVDKGGHSKVVCKMVTPRNGEGADALQNCSL